jgi:DNA-binding ferritin-like protein
MSNNTQTTEALSRLLADTYVLYLIGRSRSA